MRTFHIQTLGCKVNQYESEQVAAWLRARGLVESAAADQAELRIINTCSVTVQAASQSRQSTRRMTRLPVLPAANGSRGTLAGRFSDVPSEGRCRIQTTVQLPNTPDRPRVVVIGCWATSDTKVATEIAGVDAVLTHQDDLAAQFDQLLRRWQLNDRDSELKVRPSADDPPQAIINDLVMQKDGVTAEHLNTANKPRYRQIVNQIPASARLPLLGEHQTGRQRAFLKIQDGCDAHCTYCIIPQLRPSLWSKPVDDAVDEARRLVDAGHIEIVLTGIFLGAYGQSTALRRRQPIANGESPLAGLVRALCTRVPGLKRLRLSSLEPGDLTDDLLRVLAGHSQIVPHFHLPLQSGSDLILQRMNRQYRRDDFLRLIDRVNSSFDRPALTTDIIVGFPGESDEQFQHTLDIVARAKFIHIHSFPYSPRPGTAAARWTGQFVPGNQVNDRIATLTRLARDFSYDFRLGLIGSEAEVIVERGTIADGDRTYRRGRCGRYFAIDFESANVTTGDLVPLRVDRIAGDRTFGVEIAGVRP